MGLIVVNAVVSLVLRLVGFTVDGIAKGSMAAYIQSTMSHVASGSVFSKLTSRAMKPAL